MISACSRRGQRWMIRNSKNRSYSCIALPPRLCASSSASSPQEASTTSQSVAVTSYVCRSRRSLQVEAIVDSTMFACRRDDESRIPPTSRSRPNLGSTRWGLSTAASYRPSNCEIQHLPHDFSLSRMYHRSAVAPDEAKESRSGAKDEGSDAAASVRTEEEVRSSGDPASAKEYSYPELTADAARHKAGLSDPDVPSWQNPLHHNNPDLQRSFPEDFASPEEFEASVLPAPPLATPDNPTAAPSHVLELAEEIVQLSMLEMSELVNKIADHYGFHEGMLSPNGTGAGDATGAGMDGDDGDGSSEAASAAETAKTSWDIKLVSFQDSAKIKVIKEVRSLAGLGLKEAKELVEGAPKVVLKQVKTEDAEAIKAKLEELGATIELS